MAKHTADKNASLSGIILPSEWDESDRLVEVVLFSPEDGELVIGLQGAGRKLLGLCHCRVAVQGRVSAQGGRRVVEVASYKVLADAAGSGYEAAAGE
ncbi:MAG: hypothetical protein AB1916_05510 [Thermodesulfobacteriota bacterium]